MFKYIFQGKQLNTSLKKNIDKFTNKVWRKKTYQIYSKRFKSNTNFRFHVLMFLNMQIHPLTFLCVNKSMSKVTASTTF